MRDRKARPQNDIQHSLPEPQEEYMHTLPKRDTNEHRQAILPQQSQRQDFTHID
jgi:hypothetical protein